MGSIYIDKVTKLTPPEVGAADASPANDMPTNRIRMLATSHYYDEVISDVILGVNACTHSPDHCWSTAVGYCIEENR